jgi:tetratricopeptide (TPR) repeat protein
MSIQTLFHEALSKPPAERAAFLDVACAGQPQLRAELEVLLNAHEDSGELPAVGDVTGAFVPAHPAIALPQTGQLYAGRYKLREKLGEGGMGVVFVADQTEPVQRRVALKVIKTGADSARLLARFGQERQALALMDHPNIAKVLDAGISPDGQPYFVMELVKGVSLTKYCDDARLTPKQRLELFVPICQAVQHAHQKGIIHRDLKPSNILVGLYDGRPVPKVIDFGVAKATGPRLTEQSIYTEVGSIIGTLEYMSPEQAELNNLDIDTRSDIYALGVILYELLTGSVPFSRQELQDAGFAEMLRIIKEQEPSKPSTKLSGSGELPNIAAVRHTEPAKLAKLVRGDLDWIVMKCLEKDRARRYETANQLGMEIQRYLSDEPVVAGPPSVRYRLRKFVRRNRGPVLAASIMLFLLIGGIVGTTIGLVRADQARKTAEANEVKALDAAAEEHKAKIAEAESATKERAERVRADNARRYAIQQWQIALAVEEFLTSLLGQADVHNQPLLADFGAEFGRDPNISVRVLLDRAAKTLYGKFAGQELVEAAIRMTIGRAYWALGEYAEARKHLERSVQLFTARAGADYVDTISARASLAQVLESQGKHSEAEELFKSIIAVQVARFGADHSRTLTTKNNLAVLYQHQGKYKEAEKLIEEVVRVRNGIAKEDSDYEGTLVAKNTLGLSYLLQSKFKSAEFIFEELSKAFTAKLGPDHPYTLTSKHNLASACQGLDRLDRAEQLLTEVLDATTATRGSEHRSVATTKHALALVLTKKGDYSRAETLLKESIAVCEAKLGLDHPNTLTSKQSLAELYRIQRRFPEAEVLMALVIAGRTRTFGATGAATLSSKHELARLFRAQEKLGQAERLLKEVIEARTKLWGDAVSTMTAVHDLGEVHLSQGRIDEAEPLLKKALDNFLVMLPKDDPDTLAAKGNLGTVYRLQKRVDQAETLLRQVVEAYVAKRGPLDSATLSAKHNLAVFYWFISRLDRSVPLFEECLRGREAKLGGDDASTIGTAIDLAVNYRDARRLPDAHRVIDEWLPRATTKLGVEHPTTHFAMRTAATIYEGSEAPGKAEPLRRELVELTRRRAGADSREYATELMNLGWNIMRQAKWSDMEPVVREGLAIRERTEPGAWTTANTKSMLGGALLGLKKYAEAEPVLLASYEGLSKDAAKNPAAYTSGSVRHDRLTDALERLVQLYDAWDKKDKADEWRKKLEEAKAAKSTPKK